MVEVMAASSGGVDWSLVLRPFLSPNYESTNSAELFELCSTIVKSETEIWRHKETHKNFYNTFTVLAADYISSSISKLSGSQLETASAACRVLLKYLLNALQCASSEQYQDSVAIERYLNAVRVLCNGTGLLSTTEVSNLVDTMKGEQLPQQTNNVSVTGNEKDTTNKQESPKNRPDLSVTIFERLTLPIRDGPQNTDSTVIPLPENISEVDPAVEINRLFLRANTESLQALRAGDTLIDLCLSLPMIKKAKAKVEEALAGRQFIIPSNHAEALAHRNSLPQTVSEIQLAMSAINLPVLEPLSAPKLDKLCNLAMAALYCAVAQAAASACLSSTSVVSPKVVGQAQAANLKEEDLDSNAVKLVEEALSMYAYIGGVVKNSTRAGGHAYQNYLLAGAWVLVSGLQTHLNQTTSEKPAAHPSRERDNVEKGRPSPSKQGQQSRDAPSSAPGSAGSARSGLQKFQQCFGVLSVALATKALSLLSDLFEDLGLEVCGGSVGNVVTIEPAPLAILGQFTALQRVARILGAVPLNHLLFYLSIVSYRKACSLKRLMPPEGDNFSQSDSTVYFEDMILCSDSTDEDDDSEPILGQWFEETLAPPEPAETKSNASSHNADTKSNNQGNDNRGSSVVPEKGEVDGYISLATSIFVFLNKHFLCTKSTFVQRYVKTGLTEQQMIILAAIIRDLDREWAKSELGGQYVEFSSALMKFTHNLITSNNLTSLQACLLNHLGVSPWNVDVPHAWPLQVYPRTLTVLAQVLLLRPQNEKEASVISIWHRLVNTLIENVLNVPSAGSEADFEDLNVEHAEVLLYLFHTLNLMQKKSVVLLMAGGVLRCSEIARSNLKDSQLLNLSRLLLLFDYIMKHLYDVPTSLLEKIQRNLFDLTYLNADFKDPGTPKPEAIWKEIETPYRRITNESHATPRFYKLSNLEINNQDSPKLDGLACNFILGTPDKLRYPLLLDALIEILNVTHSVNATSATKMTPLGLFGTQYCFTICWRLLHLLPPSIPYMERLASGEVLSPGPLLMHSLIWGPRAAHKNFNRWLKDCLVKQGMYTQNTDKLLKAVSDAVNTLESDASVAKSCVTALMPDTKVVLNKEDLPPLWHLILLDCLIAKVGVSSTDSGESEVPPPTTVPEPSCIQDLVPQVIKLAKAILHCTRWTMFHSVVDQSENSDSDKIQLRDLQPLHDVLAICSKDNALLSTLANEIETNLPSSVRTVLQEWKCSFLEDVYSMQYRNDIIPSESYILKIIDVHMSSLSKSSTFNIDLSLKRTLENLVKFVVRSAPKIENTDTKNKAIELLISITTDARTEFLYQLAILALDKMIGDAETDERQKRVYIRVLDHTYNLLMNYTNAVHEQKGLINEKILHSCLMFYEKIIEKSSGRQALESFFTGDKDLVKVLMSVSSPRMSQQYSTRVLHFFNKLFQAAEKSSTDPSLNYLCSSMGKLAQVETEKLQRWLRQIILGPTDTEANSGLVKLKDSTGAEVKDLYVAMESNDDKRSLVQENSQLLQALTSYIVKQTSNVAEDVSITILKALIPLGSHILSPTLEGVGFTELMEVMVMLADAGTGRGHADLFPAASQWVELCVKYVKNPEISEKISLSPDLMKNSSMLNAASCVLDYLSDVVLSITEPPPRSVSPQWEHESPLDLELDWQEELNDDDDSGEDSDEDSLCNKLCTFTVTLKEFMNQHWYHCHTCRMLDGVGVCSICARVCHKGHDVSYAKYGNFFCDCGAKEDGSCQALAKRSPAQNPDAGHHQKSAKEEEQPHALPSSLRRRTSSPISSDKILFEEKRADHEKKKLDESKEFLMNYLKNSQVTSSLLEFLQGLIPAVESTCNMNSPVGCHVRGVKALELLFSPEKTYLHTDVLMLPTLGSQEGAFENVRMSYAGDQGQTIRQLLSAHIIRRVAMCCMTTTQGKRQHLAVSHEKGKITVLQLSALLKQADSATRKLTLNRLSSAPIPFTVLSMTSNLCNEDFLAVCGLKDCHVLTFNTNGQVTDHLVLHPQLETGNFIIKAIWLPGSQVELALVTADFVKIFDLSRDAANPQYHFLVPSGKIRDCTFMYEDGIYHIMLMSSPGHIYTEVLNEDSSTKFGSFYVTNTLEVFHLDVTDVNGHVAGGGVSIHYSHTLRLLFYSYAQGKSFISPIVPKSNCLSTVFPITIPQTSAPPNGSNPKSNSTRSPNPQPLCQWTEIPNHPGLICCAMQSSNQPVVIMIKPDTILIQEIKVVPSKSKITDMVAIRHNSGSEQRTTLILLCEDGSLKMFIANMDQTGFWMSGSIQATVPVGTTLKPKKKKPIKTGKTSSTPVFPVDFFEHCTPMNEVEFGGNDLLQIYNAAQLKHRLNSTGLYVVCNKAQFQLEVTNNDPNMVMCGIRVLVGTQDPQKAPSYIEVFGRIISTGVTRSRWYDVPFSREESLQADKKLTILFGPCQDPELMTMIDSVKVYGKTKDTFGWPEDPDEGATSNANLTNGVASGNPTGSNNDADGQSGAAQQLSKLERLAMNVFKSLDSSLYIYANEEKFTKLKPIALNIATQLLTLPTPPSIQVHSKALMLTLHPTKAQYHSYKDQALLEHVVSELAGMIEKKDSQGETDLDAESYYRLVLIVRGIAVARPQNLIKFADTHASIQDVVMEDPLETPGNIQKEKKNKSEHLLLQLIDVLWLLHQLNPEIPALAPVVVPGLKYTEQVIHALIEIIHAFQTSEAYSNISVALYLQLLLCTDPTIAFSAKLALCKVLKPRVKRRKVYIPSPARCDSPPPSKSSSSVDQIGAAAPPQLSRNEATPQPPPPPVAGGFDVDMVAAINLLEQGGAVGLNPLEALLGGAVGFPPLLDIPPDADDDTIVELAIALSLQEHEMGVAAGQGGAGPEVQALQNLQAQLRGAVQGQAAQAQQEAANFSDTTASAAGSDDEGSTAATDGSTLRTSPAEQGGSAGSESGGSGVESITGEHNVSGRSSAYGDEANTARTGETSSGVASAQVPIEQTQRPSQGSDTLTQIQEELECESETAAKLHGLRLQLLEKLVEYMPKLKNAEGGRTIPFFQVMSQLTIDLDGSCERDKSCLNSLLTAVSEELNFTGENIQSICSRSKQGEVHLLLLKLICNLLQRTKSSSSSKSSGSSDSMNYVARSAATFLHKNGIISYCLKICQTLLHDYWKHQTEEEKNIAITTGNLLKPHLTHPLPDMAPFFIKTQLKENTTDVFTNYPHLITEIILRLPYQVQRLSEINESTTAAFDGPWYRILCEYMMTSLPPASRRNARKLLLYICGNKEKYRQLRDLHALSTHCLGVKQCCTKGGYQPNSDLQHALSLPYDSLVELMEHLKACLDIASFRTGNWQRFCLHTEEILPYLLRVSFLLDDGVSPTILQLLTSALVFNSNQQTKKSESSKSSRKDREKSDDSAVEALFEESNCVALVEQINKQVSNETLARFIKAFLLENNTTTVRWQAHGLVLALYQNSKANEQESLLELLWRLWPLLPAYGKKAAQFVDLLGYFSLKYTEKAEGQDKIDDYVHKAVSVLRTQNELLAHHPNANLYAHMSQFVELDGYYLESEPCLVCNNPEVPFSTIKLSSIKVDSKFTTTTQIVKLLSSHIISKITVRIGDLKKTKMVRTINIYYNNRSVQAVVELKNKPALWHKAKKVTLQSGQTEVKIEFPLPIIACNLMVEYGDFYENIQASSETLQCPRCSASVPANPGVCANCGENVFQCHKCRAINYDERDPFLCHACGFCKYAKFDFTLQAKPCCAVEPIENDEDRKKTVSSINTLLEKADRIYKQLISNKPTLESLVLKITEHRSDRKDEIGSGNVANVVNNNNNAVAPPTQNPVAQMAQVKVNKTIQMLAQQYCNECKTSFEELSKIIQKVLASRKELVTYERKHHDMDLPQSTSVFDDLPKSSESFVQNKCYGCATASTEHCLTLLRALALNKTTRQTLCSYGLVQELVWNNLRKGNINNQEDVRLLLCTLTRDNPEATEHLCHILMTRISNCLSGNLNSTDFGASIRHEMALLAAMVQKEDDCWELKLGCLMSLFVKACENSKSPTVMESVILPCLKILQSLIRIPEPPAPPPTKKTKDKTNVNKSGGAPKPMLLQAPVEVRKFLNKAPEHSFSGWKTRFTKRSEPKLNSLSTKEEVRQLYLSEKYARKWRRRVKKLNETRRPFLSATSWLETVLFNPSSRQARTVACSIVETMSNTYERKKEIITLLTCFLTNLNEAGEAAGEFLQLYQSMVQNTPWKQFLTIKGLPLVLANLMTQEIKQIHRLETTTLTSDLAQGYALNQLTELLAGFLEDRAIRRQYKSRLVGAVLNGYLSLRRLVVQRTRLIDDTQEKLLELLEEMTTGTEEETKSFMSVCIRTVEDYSLQDILTPVFIFERLCSIIYPEENDIGEFFLTLEKDPQQEDFLQGRMLGNPYSSTEAGLGPLMRDVKNKICQDCELVALLEDDNGMELLVNNKIMSLDLPVKDVYRKIWLAEGGDLDAMRVVYRMRGLLGDATEEFIETLGNKGQSTVDNEEVYKMANVLAECGGLKVMVTRLGAIQNVWRAKPLVQVLLKLFKLCVKVNQCQEVLTEPEQGAIEAFLKILQLCLQGESDASQSAIAEKILEIMETLMSRATSKPLDVFEKLSATFGGSDYVKSLLSFTTHPSIRNNSAVLAYLTRVLAALVYGNKEKMEILLGHFKNVLQFNKYDAEHNSEDQQKLEMFCMLTNSIERNAIGNTLKDYILSLDVVKESLAYIAIHAPCVKPTLLRTDSDELKDFISKPALKYILRFLTGLAHSHENTQLEISKADTIPIIHRLEQVSSDEHVGSLAENLLEALCTNAAVAKQIEEVREFTRSEKKRLAMAMREKQLGQLGMRTNDKGQVTAKSTILQQIEELGEESGLVCCICREGYKYQPTKVLGIYTFTKRCNVEEFESKQRKIVGYSTVTHFNVVHIDCHMSAVRLARARDEWESAALQNANTKCNGLLPLWGPQVPESAFASCLARHNTYLQESTNHRDMGHASTIHDLKLLLWRFAQEKSFHEDTGGGGPQSNMHMVPYLIHVGLYVINTTRVYSREFASLTAYGSADLNGDLAYQADGPLYMATLAVFLKSRKEWERDRLSHLSRLIVIAQQRLLQPTGPSTTLTDRAVKDYSVYKPYLLFFGLIDAIYKYFFKDVEGEFDQWPTNLADYIRHNDEALMKNSEKLLGYFTEELLPCASFEEFCDVAGLFDVVPTPDSYINSVLSVVK